MVTCMSELEGEWGLLPLSKGHSAPHSGVKINIVVLVFCVNVGVGIVKEYA